MNPTDVQIACVIPAYGQPGLLAEALASVMAQTLPGVAAVVIDDGCRMPETREVALEAASLRPGRVHVLHTANGGLSAARNRGIGHALAAFPQARGIYMLDADNRILPRFLERGLALLDTAAPKVGWLYPDIDSLGIWDCADVSGEFSRLSLLLDNYCEAGSLLRREMLEAGLRYDENLRQGWEDVDFWLRGLDAGFVGQHWPDAGFRYRRRAESMLAESDRIAPELRGAMWARHRALYHHRNLMALEAVEAPRHAILTSGEDAARVIHDPATAALPTPRAAWRATMWRAHRNPPALHHPAITVFAAPAALAALRGHGLLHWAFWFAALMLRGHPAVGMVLRQAPEARLKLTYRPDELEGAQLLFVDTAGMLRGIEAAPGSASGWAASILTAPHAVRVDLEIPGEPPPPGAVDDFLAETEALAMALPAAPPSTWRRQWRVARHDMARHAFERHRIGLPMPVTPGRRNIGIIQPLHTRGGVERVLLRQAAVLRARGWTPHLFVTQAHEVALLPGTAQTYASINILQVSGREGWSDPERAYFGAEISSFGQHYSSDDAFAALLGMDAVVNTHALAGHALANRLRRAGIPTVLGLHLTERGPFGEPMGQAHSALAYEYAYDMATVISGRLRAWCLGQGWPESKLMLLRNAPGYATDEARVAAILAARAPDEARPLRAVFLGRLDAQKGLERLALIIAATQGWVEWRVAGKAVLTGPPPDLGVAVEPPAESAAELDALYAWADILLLPSRFEGVPLTILEAQRLGCVPIATDVGAVSEIITHGQDGWLLGNGGDADVAAAAIEALRALDADRGMLGGMSRQASARLATARWEDTMEDFMRWLDVKVPA